MKMPLLSKAIAALLSCGSAGRLALPAMIVAVAATIFVPASAGRFVKAVIGLTAPAERE